MAIIVVVALAVGTFGQSEPSDAERAQQIASTIRCPSCRSQAASSSDTPSSQAVRSLIKERIAAGDTDEQIRDFVASRYGREVLLDPSGSGFGGVVWALPVVLVIVAVAGLVIRFRGYRSWRHRTPTASDRAIVAEALQEQEAAADPSPEEAR